MNPMTNDDLRALVAKATPGPWRWSENGNIVPEGYPDTPGRDIEIAAVYSEEDDTEPDDAKLIVAAVNALPGLLDRISELEAALTGPEGWVLVPRVASMGIRGVLYRTRSGYGDDYMTPEQADALWANLLAAAPAQPDGVGK